MTPATVYAHLFSPSSPDDAEGYGTPGQISFMRSGYVPPDPPRLKKVQTRDMLLSNRGEAIGRGAGFDTVAAGFIVRPPRRVR